ncbi:MAG: hypothetical protein ABEK04_03400 [Candidatus Nanohalobium sp.]
MNDQDNQEKPSSGRCYEFDLPDYPDWEGLWGLKSDFKEFISGSEADIRVKVSMSKSELQITCQKR